ncbi:MAG: NUDIX domain-containing protein [Candidatus Dojkabacteria bacterium]
MAKTSSGVLLYRKVNEDIQVLLVHPGGPFWSNKDDGAWSIPKGLVEGNEDLKQTGARELNEELGMKIEINTSDLLDLGSIKMKSGKTVYAFGYKLDIGEITTNSNHIEIEWPFKSGKLIDIPEIDRAEWFDSETAKVKLNPAQIPFIENLLKQA